jgi:LacI family transcriptional regulator
MASAVARLSLKQIAKDCNLSVAAVSLALRNHPRISQATIQRVTAHAAKIGYRTNPLLHSVMSRVRAANVRKMWLNFAFVWLDATRKTIRTDTFQVKTIQAVSRRAEQLGLHLEQFFLSDPGMSPLRLEQILLARGISGVVFSPSANIPTVDLPFNWSRFSVVVMGNVPWNHNFHRAGYHHYHAMCRALEEVDRLGYARPGVVLKENLNERAERTPEAAFLTHHPIAEKARALIFRTDQQKSASAFRKWLAAAQPDCLLFPFMDAFAPTLGGVPLKGRYPYAALDQVDLGEIAGIQYEFDAIGSNAVDLLTTQILHNDHGIPARAQIVFAEGAWHDAASLPPLIQRRYAR